MNRRRWSWNRWRCRSFDSAILLGVRRRSAAISDLSRGMGAAGVACLAAQTQEEVVERRQLTRVPQNQAHLQGWAVERRQPTRVPQNQTDPQGEQSHRQNA